MIVVPEEIGVDLDPGTEMKDVISASAIVGAMAVVGVLITMAIITIEDVDFMPVELGVDSNAVLEVEVVSVVPRTHLIALHTLVLSIITMAQTGPLIYNIIVVGIAEKGLVGMWVVAVMVATAVLDIIIIRPAKEDATTIVGILLVVHHPPNSLHLEKASIVVFKVTVSFYYRV